MKTTIFLGLVQRSIKPVAACCLTRSLTLFALVAASFAAPGKLDPTFSGDGRLTDWAGVARGVAVQPDGKIVVVGTDANHSVFAIARYNPDGSPDTDFGGGDGKVTTDIGFSYEEANSVALQPDGKIVAVGTTWDGGGSQWGHFSLVRYNPDGSLDPTFGGGDGIVVTENLGTGWVAANTVALQPDGKIIAAGRTDYLLYDFPEMTVIRYNPDGSLDLPFGGDGKARIPWGPGPFGGNAPPVEDVTSIAIQPDGKIIAAGYSYGFWLYSAMVRLNTNGSIDGTFGVVFTDIGPGADVPHSVAIRSDGKIVTAGSSYNGSNNDFGLVRYNANGSLDTTFGGDGIVTTLPGSGSDEARSVAVQSDGKVVAAGTSHNGSNHDDFVLVRYNTDGSLDPTFGGGDGKTFVDFGSSNDGGAAMAIDGNGRAVVVGSSNNQFAIARLILAADPRFDYDGDGRSDVSTFRPSDGVWHLNRSADGVAGVTWGTSTDKIAPADYDGDGKTDIAVYRPSEGRWYVVNSATGTFSTSLWGLETDIPVSGDFDNDGKADRGVFRPSDGNWWLDRTTAGSMVQQFGANGDHPVVGDYDGDGRADIATFRASTGVWYINRSTAGVIGYQFGFATDKVAPADYDGDGKTDIAVYRPSEGKWYIVNSGSPTYPVHLFGVSTDIPAPGDYDGDGRADIAIFRPSDGSWWINRTTAGLIVIQWGQNGDKPTPNAFGN